MMKFAKKTVLAALLAGAMGMPLAAGASPIPVTGMALTLGGILKTIGLVADLATLFGLADDDSGSDSITIRASGDATHFDLRIRGTAVDDTTTTKLTGMLFGQTALPGGGTGVVNLWSFNLDMRFLSVQDRLIFNEEVLVNGDLMHEIGPHASDAVQGPPLGFNLRVNADDAKGGVVVDTDPILDMLHPIKHTDELSLARLRASTDTGITVDEIADWDLTLRAIHIPEPSTLAMLLGGVLVLAGLPGLRRP